MCIRDRNHREDERTELQQSYVVPVLQGDCLVHPGKLLHGGFPISSGERYVLALFYGTPYETPYEQAQRDKLKTVSYTHLRAHETVLDLVCRLLLEKKNDSYINMISYNIN
eukprot:TRINITY_DN11316_c0_g1_i1.p1 TRINITY_DN11316_c0_g1~~TRINITY_DN11316_c0_g1_i1.p1  ORF type:complete len:111 (+),score=39.50 TRINITY_DN11316_c0_g1_i1:125-457(+)